MSVTLTMARDLKPVGGGSREVAGRLIEWGAVGNGYRFARGSLYWSETGRIKLNRDHDWSQAVGVAVELRDEPDGLYGRFRIARGPEGDRALELAEDGVLDGFSVEVDFHRDDAFGPDPDDRSVTLVRRARLTGCALTSVPAFDEARLTSVAASRQNAGVTRLDVQMPDELATRARAYAEAEGVSFAEVARRGLARVTHEPSVYRFDGPAPESFVRDSWTVYKDGDAGQKGADARDRLERFTRQLKAAEDGLRFGADTTNAAAVVEPAYRPLLTQTIADRPFRAAATVEPLGGPQPFTMPGDLPDPDQLTDAHTEGTNPTESAFALNDAITVVPKGRSGVFTLTREIVDASNPALDTVIVEAMRESYARQVEALLYAECNGTNGQAGTITAGFVPSGAQASTAAAGALPAELKAAIARYPFARKRKARSGLLSAEAVEALSGALDETTGDESAMWRVQGAALNPAPAITGNAAGDADVFLLGQGDLYLWESPLLSFRFDEREGPGKIVLALYGYSAVRLVRPVGLAAIRYTAA